MRLLFFALFLLSLKSVSSDLKYEWQKRGETDGGKGEKEVRNFDLNKEYVPSSPSSDSQHLLSSQTNIRAEDKDELMQKAHKFLRRKEPFEYKQDSHNIRQRKYSDLTREKGKEKNEIMLARKRENEAKRRLRIKNDPNWTKKKKEHRMNYEQKLKQARKNVRLGVASQLQTEKVFRRRQRDNRKRRNERARKKAKAQENDQ